MQCPTCGTNNAPRALHCEKCGATLSDAEPGFRDDGLRAATPAASGASTTPAMAAGMGGVGGVGVMSTSSPGATDETSETLDTPSSKRRTRRERGEEPGWLNSALVLGTAVFAAIALLGIWWNLRAPYVDPVPKPPGGLVVTPFNSGNEAPPALASGGAATDASAALARAQALAAVDAAASGAAADVAASANTAVPEPLSASAATAALTAAATSMPRPAPAQATPAPDDMMQLLERRGATTNGNAARPKPNADLPAHYDDNDIGPIAAAEAQHQATPAQVASAPSAASAVAAALAKCERYRWFEVIPKQRCIWAVCSGRWGRDGCPAGTNPGEPR